MTNETVLLQRSLAGRFGGRWSAEPLHASSFCATWGARGRGQRLFVKSVPLAAADVLEAEADGLEALASMRAIAVPEVAGCWRDGEHGLALQWLELRPPDAGFGERYGRALGELHRGIPPAAKAATAGGATTCWAARRSATAGAARAAAPAGSTSSPRHALAR
ncbi:fructosamine kinase family protein [Caldimonas thermodepolymerans]|uniref:fructosamine kinase family protein n=1 Tax=Caldimonas thermodepolymerans TaxID=215580 RepID=UPI0030149853